MTKPMSTEKKIELRAEIKTIGQHINDGPVYNDVIEVRLRRVELGLLFLLGERMDSLQDEIEAEMAVSKA